MFLQLMTKKQKWRLLKMVDTNKNKFRALASAIENANTLQEMTDDIGKMILFAGSVAANLDELMELHENELF
jgi:hypothetical protein